MSTASVTRSNWWALVLGGVASLLFGAVSVFWPGLTLTTLLYLFSAYVLIVGVADAFAGLGSADVADSWFLPVILGAFEVGVGVYLLRHVHAGFNTFIILIGIVLIARGVIESVGAFFANRLSARSQAASYLCGLAGLAAGIVVFFSNKSGGASFVWILGTYAIVVGTLHIAQLGEGVEGAGRRR